MSTSASEESDGLQRRLEKYQKLLNTARVQLASKSYIEDDDESTELEGLRARLVELYDSYYDPRDNPLGRVMIVAASTIQSPGKNRLPANLRQLSFEELVGISVGLLWSEIHEKLEAEHGLLEEWEANRAYSPNSGNSERPTELVRTTDVFEVIAEDCGMGLDEFRSLLEERLMVRRFVNSFPELEKFIVYGLEDLKDCLEEEEMNEVIDLIIGWLAKFHADAYNGVMLSQS